jgi:membrane-associated phospholipid phosphatase
MWILLRSLGWQIDHWDVALSYVIGLPQPGEQLAESQGWVHAARRRSQWIGSSLWLLTMLTPVILSLRGDLRVTGSAPGWSRSLLTTAFAVSGIKAVVRRPPPQQRVPGSVFPSANLAFLGASAYWMQSIWRRSVWISVPISIAVAWSRVRLGRNYVGDVVAGLGIGWLVAWATHRKGAMRRRGQSAHLDHTQPPDRF